MKNLKLVAEIADTATSIQAVIEDWKVEDSELAHEKCKDIAYQLHKRLLKAESALTRLYESAERIEELTALNGEEE